MTTKSHAWYAERYTERYGFELIPLKPRSKLPIERDWGLNTLNGSAPDYFEKNPTHNIGVALGPSFLCSLDIDCEPSFLSILRDYGIPAETLDSMPTVQGRGKRVMFRVPVGTALPYAKLNWPSRNDPDGSIHRRIMQQAAVAKEAGDRPREKRLRAIAKRYRIYTVFELRVSSDDSQRFDVLPPSVHPETGEPYRWLVQPPKTLDEWPTPPDWLMAIWEAWESFKPQFRDACPWAPRHESVPVKHAEPEQHEGDTPISVYLSNNSVTEALEAYGYQRKGRRYLSPHSGTGLPGVTVLPHGQSCWIHHASDPLCSEESGKPVNAFDLYCYYEHNGDTSAACKRIVEVYNLKPRPRKPAPTVPAINEPPPELPPAGAEEVTKPAQQQPARQGPFIALGYNRKHYYYLPRGTEQVVEISRGAHTSPSELMSLASLEWWESHYPKEGKNSSGVDWQAAASALLRACERAGIYSPERERGRGAWHDDGRAVLHLGDHLLVDGERTAISDHNSEYIYTRGVAVASGIANEPATAEDCRQVRGIVSRLAWVKPIHIELLLGWTALAPICGALSWRPHMWLTTQRGGGKSWVQNRIISPLVGPMALVVQGGTTEAGIRQKVASDARAVMFDEAEAENAKGSDRMQRVMELARQSSSCSGAEIVKGGANGDAQSFRMRSMFFMSSINVGLSMAADESRFSVVQLAKPQLTPEEFSAFELEVDGLLTREFCAGLRARMYRMIPTIRATAKTLSNAVAEHLGSQRMGDQVGTLLAGCWCLEHDEAITDLQALAWVQQLDFSDAEEAEQVSDEEACLQTLLQAIVRHDTGSGSTDRSIGELIDIAMTGGSFDQSAANGTLSRHGFRVDDGMLAVSNGHHEVKKMLANSPWGGGWRRILSRLPGAYPSEKSLRFAGSITRAVLIPINW